MIRKFLIVVCSLFCPEHRSSPTEYGRFGVERHYDSSRDEYKIILVWGDVMKKYEKKKLDGLA